MIQPRFPAATACSAEALLAELARPVESPLRIGDPRMLDFLDEVSTRLREPARVRRLPELAPLAGYLRRAHLQAELARLPTAPGTLRFPRGRLFHVAPGNADTVFMYSWAVAALAGNTNLVRLSERAGAVTAAILEVMNEALCHASSVIAQTQRIVGSTHDADVMARLSRECELRVLWGGDEAILAMRQFPLAPAARDLVFPDRSSFAAISVEALLSADEPERHQLADAFYRDAYLFGQAACASPRTVFWVGTAARAAQAQALFWPLLQNIAQVRQLAIDPAMAVHKRAAAMGLAVEGLASQLDFHGNEVAVATLAPNCGAARAWLGTGTFAQRVVTRLDDLCPTIQHRDQTLAYYGFAAEELRNFAIQLGGRGIDRMVPIGQALAFASTWDGYDLLHEFTRLVTVS
jgi:hypothetical protein